MNSAPATTRLPGTLWLGAVLALVLVALAELGVRATVDRVPRWYGAAAALAARARVHVLFIGSSRVQAAVRPAAFAAHLAQSQSEPTLALNMGLGYATTFEHYLGIRNLLTEHAQQVRGLVVFMEAPGGVPWPTRAHEPWAAPEQPWMLVDLLRPRDLPGLLRAPGLDVATRIHLGVRWALRGSALVNRRERVRVQVLEHWLPRLAALKRPDLGRGPALGVDLQGPELVSFRVDEAGVQAARAQGLRFAEAMLASADASLGSFEDTVEQRLVRLVQDAGGQVVFFEPPQSTPFQRVYARPARRADVAAFALQAEAWGTPVLRPAFAYDDDDLPDLWHLRPERAEAFSRALAEAWLAQRTPARP
jgi:hypothetical protein